MKQNSPMSRSKSKLNPIPEIDRQSSATPTQPNEPNRPSFSPSRQSHSNSNTHSSSRAPPTLLLNGEKIEHKGPRFSVVSPFSSSQPFVMPESLSDETVNSNSVNNASIRQHTNNKHSSASTTDTITSSSSTFGFNGDDVEEPIIRTSSKQKRTFGISRFASGHSSSSSKNEQQDSHLSFNSYFTSIKNSFKLTPHLRDNNDSESDNYDLQETGTARNNDSDSDDDSSNHNNTYIKKGALNSASTPLTRQLTNRHLQMLAVGGTIGIGLFLGSASSLSQGGPAALVIGYLIVSFMMMFTIQALSELSVTFPVAGSFSTYTTRFVDPSWGFATGWTYAMQWLIAFPLELVAASIAINYWTKDQTTDSPPSINPAAWVAIFWVTITTFNLFGVKVYGEIEVFFSSLKILALLGFIILGIVLTAGGAPNGMGYIGGKYWHNPGSFANGFKGVCTVFVNAAFAYSGVELSGLAAAEAKNPRRAIPSAVKKVCWNISSLYIVSLVVIGCLVPYNDQRLVEGTSMVDINVSPFVIAIENAGIKGLPSVFNSVILLAVLSVANSSIYGCSRTLAALADQNLAPKQLGYIDNAGRPIFALLTTFVFGLIAFIASSDKQDQVFDWLVSLTGLACLFSWFSICISHIRFRQALHKLGRDPNTELIFHAPLGVWGSIVSVVLIVLILCLQFWIALFPIGSSSADAETFFSIYLCLPVVILLFLPHKLYFRTKMVKLEDIDVDTGRRQLDLELMTLEIEEEKIRLKQKGWIYYLYNVWC